MGDALKVVRALRSLSCPAPLRSSARSSRAFRVVRIWLFASLMLPVAVIAQVLAGGIEEVKAAYLYRFVSYVEWPESAFVDATSPIVIGVAGADEIYAELARVLGGRSSHGRPLAARRLAIGDSLQGVHLLYVGESTPMRSAWLQGVRDRPVLLVTDAPHGLEAGGALNFVPVQDRLRFEASLRAVDRAGLKVSSRLLALAQRVVSTP